MNFLAAHCQRSKELWLRMLNECQMKKSIDRLTTCYNHRSSSRLGFVSSSFERIVFSGENRSVGHRFAFATHRPSRRARNEKIEVEQFTGVAHGFASARTSRTENVVLGKIPNSHSGRDERRDEAHRTKLFSFQAMLQSEKKESDLQALFYKGLSDLGTDFPSECEQKKRVEAVRRFDRSFRHRTAFAHAIQFETLS